jgi:hypothetical protein
MFKFDFDFSFFYSDYINDDNFLSGFGTRDFANAKYLSEANSAFLKMGLNQRKIVSLGQIHSVNVADYYSTDEDRLIKIDDTDGVVTADKNIALIIRTADCVPIIFCDKDKGIIGISHQGWRGSLKRLPQKMISKMIEKGAQKETIKVIIGPAIGSCCYDINDDRYYSFLEEFNGYSEKIFYTRKAKKHVSLSLLNYLLLIESGIDKKNIDFFPFCTSCDKKRFFSYRRDDKRDYGEMLSFVIMK